MKISKLLNSEQRSLSFEVFPPKTSDKYEAVSVAVNRIATLAPSYMSVTYGAGGGTSLYTAKIAKEVSDLGVTSLAHLSCISSSKEQIARRIAELKEIGIENILALRGDIPEAVIDYPSDYRYAYELIDDIRASGDFCIGAACYPECHPESENIEKDIEYLKNKVSHGCDFLTTQMFFDNAILYKFSERLNASGIDCPVVAGIMPVTAVSQLERIVKLSGNALPDEFIKIVEKYSGDSASFKQAGIEYAIRQARGIYDNGFRAVHIYTMNKYDVASDVKLALEDYLK